MLKAGPRRFLTPIKAVCRCGRGELLRKTPFLIEWLPDKVMNNLLGFGDPPSARTITPLPCLPKFPAGRQTHFRTRIPVRRRSYTTGSPREPNRKTLSFEYKGAVSLSAIIYTWWRPQKNKKINKKVQLWCWNVPPNCFPALWTGSRFTALWWFQVCCPGGNSFESRLVSHSIICPWNSSKRDEVEFRLSFHPTRRGSCFSRRRLDISVTSSRHPRKHSPDAGRQLSLLNLAATKKQVLDMTGNKTLLEGWAREHSSRGKTILLQSSLGRKQQDLILGQIALTFSQISNKLNTLGEENCLGCLKCLSFQSQSVTEVLAEWKSALKPASLSSPAMSK